jgi:hypothetical protein
LGSASSVGQINFILLISFSFSYSPTCYPTVLVIIIVSKNPLVISSLRIIKKNYLMPNFNTSRYLPTLIFIGYTSILNNKIEQLFCSRIYPEKVTSPKNSSHKNAPEEESSSACRGKQHQALRGARK